MRSPLPAIAFGLICALASQPAMAQSWDPYKEGGEVVMVQDRGAVLRHEFAFGGGALPLDAYYTGYTLSGTYTYHPSQLFAWEVVSAFLSDNTDTELRGDLLERFEVQPTRFEKITASAMSHLVFKPFYGKRAWFNTHAWPAETSLLVGAGVVKYSQSLRAAADLGILFRLHLSDWFSVRTTIRQILPVDVRGGMDSVLHLDLAAAFNFGKSS